MPREQRKQLPLFLRKAGIPVIVNVDGHPAASIQEPMAESSDKAKAVARRYRGQELNHHLLDGLDHLDVCFVHVIQ